MSKDKHVGTPQTAIHINTNTLCAVIVLATMIFRNVNKDMLGVILNCLATFAVEPMRYLFIQMAERVFYDPGNAFRTFQQHWFYNRCLAL